MHFGFALDSSNIDLLNIDLLDTQLDLLDTDIPSKHFLCLEDVFTLTIFRLPRHLEDFLKMSWKTKNCYAEDVLETTWRHDLKTNKCVLGSSKVNNENYFQKTVFLKKSLTTIILAFKIGNLGKFTF